MLVSPTLAHSEDVDMKTRLSMMRSATATLKKDSRLAVQTTASSTGPLPGQTTNCFGDLINRNCQECQDGRDGPTSTRNSPFSSSGRGAGTTSTKTILKNSLRKGNCLVGVGLELVQVSNIPRMHKSDIASYRQNLTEERVREYLLQFLLKRCP